MEKVRLNKFVAENAEVSRRRADELIEKKRVTVNNKVVEKMPFFVDPESDVVKLNGEVVSVDKDKKIYIALNKPLGYVTTLKDKYAKNIISDLYDYKIKKRIYPVGRLDANTTGLLLLTNDGQWSNGIMHPKNEIYKEYIAKLDKAPNKNDLNKLRSGVYLDGVKTAPSIVKVLNVYNDSSLVSISICEGRNHQVRNMFKVLGYKVLMLKRVKIGTLELGALKVGEFRRLSKEEVESFRWNINS